MRHILKLASLIWVLTPLAIVAQPMGNEVRDLAKDPYRVDAANSLFTVKGTSTLHDWEMTSRGVSGFIECDEVAEKGLCITAINLRVKVESLESGKRIMDNKCYNALKYKKNPEIIYEFDEIASLEEVGEHTYRTKLSGRVTIAGVQRKTLVDAKVVYKGNSVNITGAKDMLMSDFDVEPPKALMGTIKTGNEITVEFNLNFK